jgi:hypothetical protein
VQRQDITDFNIKGLNVTNLKHDIDEEKKQKTPELKPAGNYISLNLLFF